MSERERCPAHVDGIPNKLYLRKEPDAYDWVHDQEPGIEPDETEYIRADLAAGREAKLVELLRRYRNETPLGHQPHMIAGEVDAILAKFTSGENANAHEHKEQKDERI